MRTGSSDGAHHPVVCARPRAGARSAHSRHISAQFGQIRRNRRRSDDEFNALFAELSQRTYTLYCFTREADGKAEAAAGDAGARRSAAAIARERSAVSIGQFVAEAAAVTVDGAYAAETGGERSTDDP